MKLTTAMLALGLGLGTAWAQNPDVIDNTRNTLQNVQKKQTIDQNAVLAASGQTQSKTPTPSPAAGQPKPAASQAAVSNSAAAQPKPAASKAAVSNSAAAQPKPAASKAAGSSSAPAKPTSPATAQGKPAAAGTVPGHAPKAVVAKGKKKTTAIAVKAPAGHRPAVAVEDKKNPVEPKKEPKTYSAAGRRDPFISPVVSRTMVGSGCSTGKRCLTVDQISLQGVVRSDSGMIAVVVNALNKAYFLRENDPVFNGYVVKITGDSIIFKETVQDKMGKPLEREVTKKISTPAV